MMKKLNKISDNYIVKTHIYVGNVCQQLAFMIYLEFDCFQ